MKVDSNWSANLAYAIGLIASDGNLSSSRKYIQIKAADKELAQNFKLALSLNNKIAEVIDRRGSRRINFHVGFIDYDFYRFLNSIGVTAAKSKTINSVEIPKDYFPDFLRGLFDGDGTFYTSWDKRWVHSFLFKLSFASASPNFIHWLRDKIYEYYELHGYFHKGDGVTNLEYTKGATKKLFEVMYYQEDLLFLNRKYLKIANALEIDKKFGISYLQKKRRDSSVGRAKV